MTRIIGLSGLKGSGKNAAADCVDHLAYAFAAPIKELMAFVLRVEIECFHDPEIKDTVHGPSGKTYRQWLQHIGTEGFRAMWEDVWVEFIRGELEKSLPFHHTHIITDVRFPNEAKMIRELGGVIVHVERPGVVANDSHQSENHELEYDYIITNNGTMDDLAQRMEVILNDLGKQQ